MVFDIGKPATMEEILQGREERAVKVDDLVKKFGLPVLSVSVNIPGSIKLTENSIKVFDEACKEIELGFGERVLYSEVSKSIAGCYGLFSIDSLYTDIKSVAVQIEDNHPLGRLIDADVTDISMKRIGRDEIGMLPRKCLICDSDAKICGRSRTHSVEELIAKFDDIVFEWEKTL